MEFSLKYFWNKVIKITSCKKIRKAKLIKLKKMMDEENFNAKKASDQGYDFGNETDRDQGIHDEPITGQRGNVDIKMQKRTVVFGQSRPELGNNNIRTSKYTLLTFFPFNLFEQLIKTANIYFLVSKFSASKAMIQNTFLTFFCFFLGF